MKYIIILLIACFIVGCEDDAYPIYTYYIGESVPDSSMPEVRKWITETTRAAHQNLSAGDYEDAWVTIRESQRAANEIFSVRNEGLWMKERRGSYGEFIPIEKMTCAEAQIFEKLKIQCQ